MGIATFLETSIDKILLGFISTKSAALCSALIPLALTGTSVYIIMMGWAVMRGEAADPLHTLLWKWFKISLVAGIALSAGEYQGTVVEAISAIPGILTQAFGNANTVGAMVDNAADPLIALASQLMGEATTYGIPNVSLLASAALVACAEAFMFVVGLGIYIVAKVTLALLLAVGPIFILCLMWPAAQSKFEGWLGATLGFAFLQGMVGAAIGMLYNIVTKVALKVNTTAGVANILDDTLGLFVIVITLCVVILSLPTIASQITGGSTVQGLGQMAGRAIGNWLNRSSNDGKPEPTPKNDIENKTPNGDQNQNGNGNGNGNNNSGNRGGGATAPLYQRHVLDNIRKGATR